MKPTAPLRDNFSVFATTPCAWLISFSLDHAVNWEAISAIGQIVGAIGVVVSLIYVATEVRNSARATQLASRRSISEIFTLLSRQLAEHPDLRELYYRGLHDFESLEGTDLVGFAQVMLQLFRAYEEAYYGHLEGMWIHVCGVGGKRPCAISTDILEFRLIGVHARIGTVRSSRSTLISYSRQPSLRGCIANQ